MEMQNDEAQQYIHYDYLAVPPVVHEWMPTEHIRKLLRREWERNIQLIDDTAHAKFFRENRPVAGTTADDYRHRCLELGGGRSALVGIRFRRFDPGDIYVDILHRNFPLDSPLQVRELAREVLPHYEVFQPRTIRVYDGVEMFGGDDTSAFAHGHFRYYAAPVQALKQLSTPEHFGEIALERISDIGFYDTYREMYARLHSEHPHLHIVPVESQETMENCMTKGQLYKIIIEGQFAGVIGALPHEERFLSGYIIAEEILDSPFRRRGFAAALQRRLLEELDESDFSVLFGHISPLNTASLRTAAKVGRRDVGGAYFVEP